MDIMEKIYEIADWVKTRPDFSSLKLEYNPKRLSFDVVCYGVCEQELNRWAVGAYRVDAGYRKVLEDFVKSANTMQHVIVDEAKKPMYESKEYQSAVIEPVLGIHIALSNKPIEDDEDYLLEYPEN